MSEGCRQADCFRLPFTLNPVMGLREQSGCESKSMKGLPGRSTAHPRADTLGKISVTGKTAAIVLPVRADASFALSVSPNDIGIVSIFRLFSLNPTDRRFPCFVIAFVCCQSSCIEIRQCFLSLLNFCTE